MFEGAGKVPFKKTLSLQSYLNELIVDKILCMATMSEVVVLTCKESLHKKEPDKKNAFSSNSVISKHAQEACTPNTLNTEN